MGAGFLMELIPFLGKGVKQGGFSKQESPELSQRN